MNLASAAARIEREPDPKQAVSDIEKNLGAAELANLEGWGPGFYLVGQCYERTWFS